MVATDEHANHVTGRDNFQEPSDWSHYVRYLEKDGRDIEGKLLKKGAKVLFHPSQPDVIRIDNSVNRQEFIRQDKTWTLPARQSLWFPPLSDMTEELEKTSEDSRSVKNNFLGNIRENVLSAKNKPIPEVKSLPFWFTALAWEPKIKKIEEVADLTEELCNRMIAQSGTPEQVSWPKEWHQWLRGMNGLKVYALQGMTATVHVIAAVTTSVKFESSGKPFFFSPGQEAVEGVRETYLEWVRDNNQQAVFMFFTLASVLPWKEKTGAYAAGDHWFVLSSQYESQWLVDIPPRYEARKSLHNFMDRLRPETRQDRVSKIKSYIDKLLNMPYGGNIHLDKIATDTGYRRTIVRDTLLALQKSGDYRVYKIDGLVAVGHKGNNIGKNVTAKNLQSGGMTHFACLVPAVTVAVWCGKDLVLGKPFDAWIFAALIPLAYGGEWIKTRLQKGRGD